MIALYFAKKNGRRRFGLIFFAANVLNFVLFG